MKLRNKFGPKNHLTHGIIQTVKKSSLWIIIFWIHIEHTRSSFE